MSYDHCPHGIRIYESGVRCLPCKDQTIESLHTRLVEAELSRDSWKREADLNQQSANESARYAYRLATALNLLEAHSIHIEEAWCWCQSSLIDCSAESGQSRQVLMADGVQIDSWACRCGATNGAVLDCPQCGFALPRASNSVTDKQQSRNRDPEHR